MDNKQTRPQRAARRSSAAGELRGTTATDLRGSARQADPDHDHDEAAMRGEVLPLGNSVLEDVQGTFE